MIRRNVAAPLFRIDALSLVLTSLIVVAAEGRAVGAALTQGALAGSVRDAEIYNALNSSALLAYNNTYVPQGPWLQPLSMMTPRYLKLTGQMDF